MDLSEQMGRLGDNRKGKEMLYLMTHSTHFIYGYMASDILTYGPFGADGMSGREREKCFI